MGSAYLELADQYGKFVSQLSQLFIDGSNIGGGFIALLQTFYHLLYFDSGFLGLAGQCVV